MKKTGFSLIETIVAMTILVTILLSGAQLLSTLFTAQKTNQDKNTASYLAQECLEITRNNRDTNWLQNKPWNKYLDQYISKKHGIFSRKVSIQTQKYETIYKKGNPEEFPSEILIRCEIEWENITGKHSLSMNQILTNWRKK